MLEDAARLRPHTAPEGLVNDESARAAIATCLERLTAERFAPVSTYRLQLHRGFSLADARRRLKYLAELGVGAVYASPILTADPGSAHGYDIVDHGQINPELGGEPELQRFAHELDRRGLGLVLDVVPNHMSVAGANRWWHDVLENGRASPYAAFFDIDWHPPRAEMADTVLLPILGDQFGRVLDRGELRLVFKDGTFSVHYYDHILPLSSPTYAEALQPALDRATAMLPAEDGALLELQSIITAARNLPAPTETDAERIAEGRREALVIRRRLQDLAARSAAVHEAIDAAVAALNGVPNDAASHEALADLLSRQPYRLSHWRVATDEINYRRFFDINGLAALRMDRPEVFAATHALVLRLLARGVVQGLRIDHIDGLLDPAAYLWRLQASYVQARCDAAAEPAPRETEGDAGDVVQGEAPLAEQQILDRLPAVRNQQARPLYIVVEKILGHGERLPSEWPVDGTTGYDFLNAVNGVFVDGSQRRAFDALYAAFIGERLRYRDLVYEAKKQIMRVVLASEVNVLGLQLSRIAAANRWYRDFSLTALTAAIVETIACFPIYRTYVRFDPAEGNVAISERDLLYIDLALTRARRLNPVVDPSIFDFVQETLTLAGGVTGPGDPRLDFALKFQQVTGPVMAKGVEDTAFYRYNRLISLNEVGGDPDQFGISLAAFHRQCGERQAHVPQALLATSTHDTKRSEDV
ncbi:MAG TPA: malto-oligosyltrehalose synthase, partial [Dehalococcoidia bacterium]